MIGLLESYRDILGPLLFETWYIVSPIWPSLMMKLGRITFWPGTDVGAGVCDATVKGKGSSNIKQSNPIPHNMVQIKIK